MKKIQKYFNSLEEHEWDHLLAACASEVTALTPDQLSFLVKKDPFKSLTLIDFFINDIQKFDMSLLFTDQINDDLDLRLIRYQILSHFNDPRALIEKSFLENTGQIPAHFWNSK